MPDLEVAANEYLLSINDINQPMSVTNNDKVVLFIVRLLLLEPGTYQSNPNMGVGLVSRYRYTQDQDIESLTTVVRDQIQTYLPGYNMVDVRITPVFPQEILKIQVVLNNIAYNLIYDIKHENITL